MAVFCLAIDFMLPCTVFAYVLAVFRTFILKKTQPFSKSEQSLSADLQFPLPNPLVNSRTS